MGGAGAVAGAPGHICWLVDDDGRYRDDAAAVLAEGRDRGEKTAVFGPRGSSELARLAADADMAADPYVDVLRRGPLDPGLMFGMFREQSALARSEGYSRLLVVADMDWLRRHWQLAGFDDLSTNLALHD